MPEQTKPDLAAITRGVYRERLTEQAIRNRLVDQHKPVTPWDGHTECACGERLPCVVAGDLTALLGELGRLRERDARLHVELRDRRTDDLEVRGHLSPQPGTGPGEMLPIPIGKTLAPSVEWLVNEVADLRAQVERMRLDRPAYQRIADEKNNDLAWLRTKVLATATAIEGEGLGLVATCTRLRAIAGGGQR
jgi:hypothetical protein